jgi:hypothetical protein
MSHSRLAIVFQLVGLALLVGPIRPTATAAEKNQGVPAQARVSVEIDKKEYYLGENVLLHFCIENSGAEPFTIELGGDYRGASRHLRFHVQALDAEGKLCADPDPSGFCMGGLGHSPAIKSGQKHYESIPLLRYRRIDKPGVYKIQVSHDLGWSETPDRKLPVAETTITFVKPSEVQARKLVEAMFEQSGSDAQTSGKKSAPYADFSALRDPVYLPILLERAREKSEPALIGIGSIASTAATEALIQLAKHDDPQFALSVAQTLNMRLPDPQLYGQLPGRNPFLNDHLDSRRWLVNQSWRARMTNDVANLAPRFLARADRAGMECGAYMLQCAGRKEDVPHLIRALDREIAAAAQRPLEDKVYPRPRGACGELLRAARVLSARFGQEPLTIDTPGQAVVFLCAVGRTESFRPDGWERQYARLLQHEVAYVREVALDNLPLPAPEPLLKLLPGLITDKDIDVQIAACHVAEKIKRAELKEPVLKVLATAREHWQFNAASNAASALGAHWERLEILVSRLDEVVMTQECLSNLLTTVVDNVGGWSGPSDKWTAADARTCKARWVRFLQEHGKTLKAGNRFKRDDPAITPDLFPTVTIGK